MLLGVYNLRLRWQYVTILLIVIVRVCTLALDLRPPEHQYRHGQSVEDGICHNVLFVIAPPIRPPALEVDRKTDAHDGRYHSDRKAAGPNLVQEGLVVLV